MKKTKYKVIFSAGSDIIVYADIPEQAAILAAAKKIESGNGGWNVIYVKNLDNNNEYPCTLTFEKPKSIFPTKK